MHKSRLAVVVIDCQTEDLGTDTAFWSSALGYEAIPPGPDGDPLYVDFKAPPDEVRVLLQRVDHAPRVHLDIETDDIEAEAKRLEALGAKRIAFIKRWQVMEAPSGHRFCLVGPQRADFDRNANVWD